MNQAIFVAVVLFVAFLLSIPFWELIGESLDRRKAIKNQIIKSEVWAKLAMLETNPIKVHNFILEHVLYLNTKTIDMLVNRVEELRNDLIIEANNKENDKVRISINKETETSSESNIKSISSADKKISNTIASDPQYTSSITTISKAKK